jgi:prepilin-type N-terminal cleavage/methylation domain-containing protein
VSANRSHSSRGFSLIELLVAMTVTLIVSGAVYGLLTAGKTAFRREPALTDRQQNIRVAMDLISRDVLRAGFGLPEFAQAFTEGLDAKGPLGPGGDATDEIEFLAASDCPVLHVCKQSGSSVDTMEIPSSCYGLPALVLAGRSTDPVDSGSFWAEQPSGPGGGNMACADQYEKNGHLVFPHGQNEINPPGGLPFVAEWIVKGDLVRYRINLDAEGVPNLERSVLGGNDYPGVGGAPGASSWEIVARGIEDLQLEYENATGWSDTPGVVVNHNSLVRRVRIRLSARALEANLQGQTTSAVGDAARGQLVTEVAPRAAAITLGMAKGEL